MDRDCEHCLMWRKSSQCGTNACVEIDIIETGMGTTDRVFVRNTEQPHTVLQFTGTEWQAFVAGVKNDEFNL